MIIMIGIEVVTLHHEKGIKLKSGNKKEKEKRYCTYIQIINKALNLINPPHSFYFPGFAWD